MCASERDDSACSSRNHSVTWRSHRFGQNVCPGLGSTFTEGQARRHDAETLWGCLCFRVNAFVARTASDLRDALFSLCVQDIKLFVGHDEELVGEWICRSPSETVCTSLALGHKDATLAHTRNSTRKSHSALPSALADSGSTQLHTLPGIPKGLLRRIPLRLPPALRYEHLNI